MLSAIRIFHRAALPLLDSAEYRDATNRVSIRLVHPVSTGGHGSPMCPASQSAWRPSANSPEEGEAQPRGPGWGVRTAV